MKPDVKPKPRAKKLKPGMTICVHCNADVRIVWADGVLVPVEPNTVNDQAEWALWQLGWVTYAQVSGPGTDPRFVMRMPSPQLPKLPEVWVGHVCDVVQRWMQTVLEAPPWFRRDEFIVIADGGVAHVCKFDHNLGAYKNLMDCSTLEGARNTANAMNWHQRKRETA